MTDHPALRRLSALDTQFLNVESSTTTGHVGSLIILDPSTAPAGGWGLATVRPLLEARLHLSPVFRQRLVRVPFGLSRPYWADDPAFDLDFHVRELALPSPGSPSQLGDLVARLHSHALDLDRPLWELYVVTGLADGRAAVYSKVHHAAIDGVGGAQLLTTLLDLRPEPRTVPEPDPAPPPSPLPSWSALLGRGVVAMVGDQAAAGLAAAPALRGLAATTSRLKAPSTPFNRAISAHRRFAYGSLPMADVKSVRERHGGTVNDVVMAVCASALRRWLIEHDGLPEGPLVAAVPVSVRRRERKGEAGNEISVMLAELPTQVTDPVDRLAAARASMDRAKAKFDEVPKSLADDLAALLPTAPAATRSMLGLATVTRPLFNLFISNVPGPRVPLYLAGAVVEGIYPVSAVTDFTGALNITVFTRKDSVDIGIVACRDLVPDVANLLGYLREALDELVLAGEADPATRGEASLTR